MPASLRVFPYLIWLSDPLSRVLRVWHPVEYRSILLVTCANVATPIQSAASQETRTRTCADETTGNGRENARSEVYLEPCSICINLKGRYGVHTVAEHT